MRGLLSAVYFVPWDTSEPTAIKNRVLRSCSTRDCLVFVECFNGCVDYIAYRSETINALISSFLFRINSEIIEFFFKAARNICRRKTIARYRSQLQIAILHQQHAPLLAFTSPCRARSFDSRPRCPGHMPHTRYLPPPPPPPPLPALTLPQTHPPPSRPTPPSSPSPHPPPKATRAPSTTSPPPSRNSASSRSSPLEPTRPEIAPAPATPRPRAGVSISIWRGISRPFRMWSV